MRGKYLEKMVKSIDDFKFHLLNNWNPNPIFGKLNLPIVVEDLQIKEFLKKELSTLEPKRIEIKRLWPKTGFLFIIVHVNKGFSNGKIKRITKELKNMIQKDLIIKIQKLTQKDNKDQSLINNQIIHNESNKIFLRNKKIFYPKFLKSRERGFEK